MARQGPDHVQLLGAFKAELATATRRTRASGATRVTIEVKGEDAWVNLSEHDLGKPIAAIIGQQIKKGIRAQSRRVTPSTVLARKHARTAFLQGKRWAVDRYKAVRLGARLPAGVSDDQYMNDSGLLHDSIATAWVAKLKSHVINVTAKRLTPEFTARNPQFLADLAKVVDNAVKSDEVTEVVANVLKSSIDVVKQGRRAAWKALGDQIKQLVESGQSIGTQFQAQFGEQPLEEDAR